MIKTKQPVVHLFIFAVVLVLAVVISYYTQKQLGVKNMAQVEADQLTQSRERLTELARLLPIYSIQGKSWLLALPKDEKEVAAFAGRVEQLASANELKLEFSFDDFPGPIDVSGKYVAGVGAQITVIGSYMGISKFVAGLTALPYYFKFDKMTLTKPDNRVGVKAIFNGALMMNLPI